MSYSQRFLDRHPPLAEDTIAEPKLMDDEDEGVNVAALDAGPHRSSRHRRHRSSREDAAPRVGSAACAPHEKSCDGSRASHRPSHAESGEGRAASASRPAPSQTPSPQPPFEVLASPHRRLPEASAPPHVADSRKIFVSPRGAGARDATEPYERALAERDAALRLLDKFKTEGNKVIQRLRQSLTDQQRENATLTAALNSARGSVAGNDEDVRRYHLETTLSSSRVSPTSSPARTRPHDAPGTTLRVIELEEKLMAQAHVVQELDKLMRSADTMLLAMRARCEAAEYRCRRLEAEQKRREGQVGLPPPDSASPRPITPGGRDSLRPAPESSAAVPPLNLGAVHDGNADASSASTPSRQPSPSAGLPGELLANTLRDKYTADPDVQAAVSQWMAAQAHLYALRASLDEERRLRLSAEEAYQRATAESQRSIALLERRLHRARSPRGMTYHGFDADLLQIPIELAPRPGGPATVDTPAVTAQGGEQRRLKGKDGRTVITLSADEAAHGRPDGAGTPPSPLLRQGDGDARSAQSTPTKLLFTMGSETAETRTAGGRGGTGTGGQRSEEQRSDRLSDAAVDVAPIATSSFASEIASYDSATIPIDATTDDCVKAPMTHKDTGKAGVDGDDDDTTTSTTERRRRKHRKKRSHEAAAVDAEEPLTDPTSTDAKAEKPAPSRSTIDIHAPVTVAPPSTVSVERDLTRRREVSEPSSPRQSSTSGPLAKPPLTPCPSTAGVPGNSAARKRFVGDRAPRETPSSAVADGSASDEHASKTTAPVAPENPGSAMVVDIPIPAPLSSAAVSPPNAGFNSVASSRASSVGSRSGRLVNIRPHSTRDAPSSPFSAPEPEVPTSQVAVGVAAATERGDDASVVRRGSTGSNSNSPQHSSRVRESSTGMSPAMAAPSSRASHHVRTSADRQRALSQGLEEIDRLNADMDKILCSLSPGATREVSRNKQKKPQMRVEVRHERKT